MSKYEGKNIIVGVTGGIAAYKSCDLVRKLVRENASVQVVMTKNATEFVTPLTMQTLSGKRVATKTFDLGWEAEIGHISLADNADLIVVAPATASFIGKVASGIADSLLSTVILAAKCPIIMCPAMNVNMYSNPAVQDNLTKLRERGLIVVEPGEGELACGWEGKGRLPETDDIVEEIEAALTPKDLSGEKVLVTAGATREHIDPVRFISNPSSGKMGYALAKEARMRGAQVKLVSGKTNLMPPYGVEIISAESASDMYEAVVKHFKWSTIIIKAAAVGDYTPAIRHNGKIKKDSGKKTIELKRTRDILKEVGGKKNGRIIIGFAAESDDLLKNARDKLKRKKADMIVANDILEPGAGFEGDTNKVHLLYGSNTEELPLMSKSDLAQKVFDKISSLLS
jgi:phosphopantothenoylcysteine decarboxylase / phosphopantothenate---cysteine ligase